MPLKNCSTYNSWNRYYFMCIVSTDREICLHIRTVNGHLDKRMSERGRCRPYILSISKKGCVFLCRITIKNLHCGESYRKKSQAMCKLIFSSVHVIYSCDNTWRNGDFARLFCKYQFYVMKNDNFDWLKWQKFCFSKNKSSSLHFLCISIDKISVEQEFSKIHLKNNKEI